MCISKLLLASFCAVALLGCGGTAQSAPVRMPTVQPNIHLLPPMAMPALDRQRNVRVYLPPGYAESGKRFPVMYMHDGQNLFDEATAYAGEWGIDESLDALAKSHGLELIVVGIDNGGDKRMTELNPWDHAQFGKGEGAQYVNFIVEVVKPLVDKNYRTRPEREHTAVMGSSMGGLISHYAIFRHPQVFSKAGIFSPAYWTAPDSFAYTAAQDLPHDAQLYFYMGGEEGQDMIANMDAMIRQVSHQPHSGDQVARSINRAAGHNEAAWRAEFPKAVLWLYRTPMQ